MEREIFEDKKGVELRDEEAERGDESFIEIIPINVKTADDLNILLWPLGTEKPPIFESPPTCFSAHAAMRLMKMTKSIIGMRMMMKVGCVSVVGMIRENVAEKWVKMEERRRNKEWSRGSSPVHNVQLEETHEDSINAAIAYCKASLASTL
ncbi:PREDICTED: uncharacterized protein LOC104816148 [Tarenaya hassleriana]|uniref:uncharacterized protein LOC104816148 n=1 Tax=Tarenaya hassleriana TaxID=28532 RepID=UPI00053C22A6|nr:PREDICTED: uncharacterized protein LOC104816148 [Tarenaya hassleriana]